MRNRRQASGLRVILGALLACLAVVLLPYEAWAATGPSGIVTGSSTGSIGSSASCGTGAAFTGTTSCHTANFSIYVTASGSVNFWYGVQTYYSGAWQNLSGSSYSGSVSWSNTYWAGAAVSTPDDKPVRYAFVNNTTGAVMGAFVVRDAITPSSCAAFTVEATSLDSNLTLFALVKNWTGTRPAGGWKVFVPGSADAPGSGTPLAIIPSSGNSVPGQYSVAVGLPSGYSGGTIRVEPVGTPSCYQIATVTTTPIGETPDNGTDASGNDCGLNPFCYVTAAIRWAFVPSEGSVVAWTAQVSTVKTHPPVSLVVSGTEFVTGVAADVSGCLTGCDFDPGPYAPVRFDAAEGGASFDPLAAAGAVAQTDGTWGNTLYKLATWAVIFAFAFDGWRRVSKSFGGKA